MEVAVLHVRLHGDELVVPRHLIGVGLHDAQVGHHGAEVPAHHGGERSVEIVRGHVDLVRVRHAGDLDRFPHPVPRRVDDGHVHGVVLEVRAVVAPAEQALARGHGHGRAAPDISERLRVSRVDLDPEEIERLHGAGHGDEALRLVVEVEVHEDVHVRPRALPESGELIPDGAHHVAVGVQLGKALARAGKARRIGARVVPQQEHVGLERGVALGHHFLAELDHVVERADGRDLQLLGVAHPVRPAMGPVEADALAHGAAQELVDGNPQSARLDVQQRVLDGGDGLLDHAARGLPPQRVHGGDVRLPRARVLADDRRGQPVDHRRETGAAERFVVLAPAHEPRIGGDLEEVEIT